MRRRRWMVWAAIPGAFACRLLMPLLMQSVTPNSSSFFWRAVSTHQLSLLPDLAPAAVSVFSPHPRAARVASTGNTCGHCGLSLYVYRSVGLPNKRMQRRRARRAAADTWR